MEVNSAVPSCENTLTLTYNSDSDALIILQYDRYIYSRSWDRVATETEFLRHLAELSHNSYYEGVPLVLVERSTLQTHQFTIMIGNVARQRFQAFYTNQNPERFIRDTLFLSVNSIPVNSLNYEKCLSETLTSDQIVTHNYPSKFAV